MADDDDFAVFICKFTTFCIFLWISIILFACSFATLEPTEFGIELNGNSKKLNTETLFQGGRHFLGLGHSFYKMPANHIMMAFSDWPELSSTQKEGCSTDDECQLKGSDCDYCLEGMAPSHEDGLMKESYYINKNPLLCRTQEGLKINIQGMVILRLGIYSSEDQQKAESLTGSSEDELFYPPQPKTELRDSLVGLFRTMDENPIDLAAISIESAIRDEVSGHQIYDFYKKRIEINNALALRIQTNLAAMNFTVVDAHFTNVGIPQELESAIMDTEIARQAMESAMFVKETQIINAQTGVLTATVEVERLKKAALRNAQSLLLEKAGSAIRTQYSVEAHAKAMYAAAQTLGYFNETFTGAEDPLTSSTRGSENIMIFKWLYALQQLTGGDLDFEMPVPKSLRIDYKPNVGDEIRYQGQLPHEVVIDLVTKAGMNATFSALRRGESPDSLESGISSFVVANTTAAATGSGNSSNSSRRMLEENSKKEQVTVNYDGTSTEANDRVLSNQHLGELKRMLSSIDVGGQNNVGVKGVVPAGGFENFNNKASDRLDREINKILLETKQQLKDITEISLGRSSELEKFDTTLEGNKPLNEMSTDERADKLRKLIESQVRQLAEHGNTEGDSGAAVTIESSEEGRRLSEKSKSTSEEYSPNGDLDFNLDNLESGEDVLRWANLGGK